tara:strand:+ start:135 stop:569 length:435 start_codon:yes stop_codon:yes gene_type:complete
LEQVEQEEVVQQVVKVPVLLTMETIQIFQDQIFKLLLRQVEVKVVMEQDQELILMQEKEVPKEDQVVVAEQDVHQHKNVIQPVEFLLQVFQLKETVVVNQQTQDLLVKVVAVAVVQEQQDQQEPHQMLVETVELELITGQEIQH